MEQNNIFTAPLLRVPGQLLLPDTKLNLQNLTEEQATRLLSFPFIAYSSDQEEDSSVLRGQGQGYGLLCVALSYHNEGTDQPFVLVHAQQRVLLHDIDETDQTCSYSLALETEDLDERSRQQMLHYIQNTVSELAHAFQGGSAIAKAAEEYDNLNQLMLFLSQYMPLSASERAQLLACDSQRERAAHFMDFLLRQKEAISVNLEMNEKFSRQNSEFYRQQALRRQLEAIKDELGESDDEEDDTSKYLARIEALETTEENKQSLKDDVRRLENTNPQSMDAEVLRTYLDFALSLPWKKEEAFEPDLAEARQALDARHSGMEPIKKRILQHLAIMKLRHSNKGSAILLVGPPGTGKTSLGKSIAQALHRPYTRLSLGGIRDESEIRGHRRTYVGAMSGRVLKAMKQAGQTNPVMILDEIDKMMAGGFSGDPSAAMLEVLDPEQNNTFTDHYLDMPYDLSNVMFIATANSLDGIPAPLLDRMEIIEVSSYTAAEKFIIAKEHLIGEVFADHGIEPDRLQLEDEALEALISGYTMEAGCRGLKKQLAALARQKAVDLLESEEAIIIRKDDLEDILGPVKVRHEIIKQTNPCGVVTGLAWTAVGGEVLFIEAASMPGSGQIILTGQLGDVMKESARIALSVLKSRLPFDTMAFEKQDLHIHFPAGATPKDGPSAGITILTALASLALQKPVDSSIAMTGELSLRGDVLPIGGLKEKLFGAVRAGITKVLIPWDNRSDLKEVPAEIQDQLTIIPVRCVEEVLEHTLHISLPELPTAPFVKPLCISAA